MTLDILCKVVDNYGDIGVVYRLARALSELDPTLELRLVVDDLHAFSLLEPLVRPGLAAQTVRGWTLLDWAGPGGGDNGAFAAAYGQAGPRIVLECFACGRPDWLEAMLFDDSRTDSSTIVNLEYLSAEPYADEFHRMPSLTRSQFVHKHIFMPGFTPKTGGLILDSGFMRSRARYADPAEVAGHRASLLDTLGLRLDADAGACVPEERFWILVFGYERNYGRIVEDIAKFGESRRVMVLVANGKSGPCFMHAWERAGRPFPTMRLPFLPQETWDEVLTACDFNIVRGEDSMARAALSGRPFLWHAYPQAGAHQLVKVQALLDRMRPAFHQDDFTGIESSFLAFNDRLADGVEVAGTENISRLLEADARMRQGFSTFSDALIANGDLASALMTFLVDIV